MASLNMPAGRDLGTEFSKTLSAEAAMLPNMLGTQAQYQPLQTSQQLSNINQLLLGTPDINYDTRSYSPAVYRQGNNYSYGGIPRGVNGLINYPTLPDPRGSNGSRGGGGGGIWLPPGVPGIPGISGGGNSSGLFNLKSSRVGSSVGGNDGGVLPGRNGTDGFQYKSSGISSNQFPGSPGSVDGMPLPPSPLGPLDPLSFFGGGDSTPPRRLITPSGYTTTHNTQGAQQGLLSLYQNYLAPTMEATQEAMSSSQRASDIADVGNFGPAAMAAIAASDPRSAGLIDTATSQAQNELGMGGNLTPGQLRQAQQAVRARSTGMLGGTGGAGDLAEAMGIGAYGQQLQQGRRQYAGNVLGQRQSFYGDPFNRVLGRPGAGLGSSANALNQATGLAGQGSIMSMLNPQSSYAGDLYNTNFNSLVNGAIANNNSQNALIGAGISAFGSLAGAGMGAMM